MSSGNQLDPTEADADRAAAIAQLAADIARVGDPDDAADGERQSTAAGPSVGATAGDEAAARQICGRLLAARQRSRAELGEALRRRDIPAPAAQVVLDRFTELGLIDDVAFAAAFVADKQRSRGLGRSALRLELRRKGVDPQIIEGAIADIDDESERKWATALVAKKLDSALLAGPSGARRRLLGMLGRRGYPAGLANSVVSAAIDGFVTSDASRPTDTDVTDW